MEGVAPLVGTEPAHARGGELVLNAMWLTCNFAHVLRNLGVFVLACVSARRVSFAEGFARLHQRACLVLMFKTTVSDMHNYFSDPSCSFRD